MPKTLHSKESQARDKTRQDKTRTVASQGQDLYVAQGQTSNLVGRQLGQALRVLGELAKLRVAPPGTHVESHRKPGLFFILFFFFSKLPPAIVQCSVLLSVDHSTLPLLFCSCSRQVPCVKYRSLLTCPADKIGAAVVSHVAQ